jgi:tetratricopeptide (TPR) repeat protein
MNKPNKPGSTGNIPKNSDGCCDLSWESVCLEAYETYVNGDVGKATVLWQESIKIADSFPDNDPRQFASMNNAGLALFLDGSCEQAEENFTGSLEGWQKARKWVVSMQVEGTAKSSLFHHRLEVRHQEQFNNHTRTRYDNWLIGAEAISAFNLSILLFRQERNVEGFDYLSKSLRLREQAYGEANPELGLILSAMAKFSEDEDAQENYLDRAKRVAINPTRNTLQRWHDDRPHAMNDTRRLMAAICLTAMLAEGDF